MGKGSTRHPPKKASNFSREPGPMALFLLVGASAIPKPAALQPAKQMNAAATLDIEVRAAPRPLRIQSRAQTWPKRLTHLWSWTMPDPTRPTHNALTLNTLDATSGPAHARPARRPTRPDRPYPPTLVTGKLHDVHDRVQLVVRRQRQGLAGQVHVEERRLLGVRRVLGRLGRQLPVLVRRPLGVMGKQVRLGVGRLLWLRRVQGRRDHGLRELVQGQRGQLGARTPAPPPVPRPRPDVDMHPRHTTSLTPPPPPPPPARPRRPPSAAGTPAAVPAASATSAT